MSIMTFRDLSDGPGIDQSRIWRFLQVAIAIAAAIGAALILLCACAGETPTATPTDVLEPTRTLPPAPTIEPFPSPSPEPGSEPRFDAPAAVGPADVDLAIQISGLTRAVPGESAIYTFTIRNDGSGIATGIVLTDLLPSGLVPVWVPPAQPWCGRQERSAGADESDGDPSRRASDGGPSLSLLQTPMVTAAFMRPHRSAAVLGVRYAASSRVKTPILIR